MKKLTTLILLLFMTKSFGQIYIHINEVASDSFPIAVVDLPPDSPDPKNLGTQFGETVRKDLELMGVFKLIDSNSFLDKTKNDQASNIDFSKWAMLDALGLVKGKYKVTGDSVSVEARLFDVLRKNELVFKKYQTTTGGIRQAAHQFANEIIRSLTGEEGIFNTKIAYVCKPGGKKELCVMNFDGSEDKQITSLSSYVLSPAWDNSGKSVYFISPSAQKNPALYRVELARKSMVAVGKFPGMVNGIGLAPNGNSLATSLSKDGNAEIYLLGLDGGIQQRLTTNQDIDVSARFSPDGKEIVFVSDRQGSPQIWKMDVNGKNPRPLTLKGKNNNSPSWSPRGDKILFSGMDTDGHCDIFSIDADGSNLVRLTYDTKDNISPSWSPSGHLVVFASNRSGKYQLYTMRADGSKQRKISQQGWDHEMPSWSARLK